MVGKGSSFSSWKSVFSFAQFKKDMVYSHNKSRFSFWGLFLYVGIQVFVIFGIIVYRIFQSIFRGNELLALKQMIFLSLFLITVSLIFRGFVLIGFSGEREKRSLRSIFVACGGVFLLTLIGKILEMQ